MPHIINYQVEMTPENSAVIDAINALLIGGETLKSETTAKTETKTPASAKEKKPAAKKEAPAKEVVTMADFKAACKQAKKDHGEEFTMAVMVDAGVESTGKLGSTISAVDGDDYEDIIDSWIAGPQTEAASDDLDDDGLGDDDDDEAEVSVDAVQTALRAYSKDTGRAEAKAIMTKNGASALSKVADCTPAQLAAMMKAMV